MHNDTICGDYGQHFLEDRCNDYEMAGTVAGITATGENRMDYNKFWKLVKQNDIQFTGVSAT